MTKTKEQMQFPSIVKNSLNGVVSFRTFDSLYTEPRMALWELQQRRKEVALKNFVHKFVSAENRSKRALCKMPIYQNTGLDGRDMVEYETVCDFNISTGKKFKEVVCLNGEQLIPFHHRLFRIGTGL